MDKFTSSFAIAIMVLFFVLILAVSTVKRKRTLLEAKSQKRKRTSDFIIMIGLVLSSVLDPAAKNRIEALDSQRKRKFEAGKENE